MVSEDFKRLMELIFKKKFQVESYDVEIVPNESIKTTISLKKNSVVETIESLELDLGLWVLKLKKVANSDGHFRLKHVKNVGGYYADIEFLLDEDGSRKKAAFERIKTGQYKPDFDFDREFEKLLSGQYSKHDKEVAKLKTQYYETLAIALMFSKKFLDLKQNAEKRDPLYAEYSTLLDDLLSKAFIKGKNAVELYKFFKAMVKIDIEGVASRALQERKFFDHEAEMLAQKGVVQGDLGIKHFLDWYRRWCELSSEFINATRIAYDLVSGKLNPREYLPYAENVKILKQSPYSKLVEVVDPYIRHTESHVTTQIDYVPGKKGEVVLLDTRKGKTKEIRRYSFEQILEMTKKLQRSLYPALLTTFVLNKTALKLLVLHSPEYKFMLLNLGR